MDIAVCEGWGPSAPYGGHQLEVAAYALFLRNLGHKVTMYVTHRPEEFAAETKRKLGAEFDTHIYGALAGDHDLYWLGYSWLPKLPVLAEKKVLCFWIDPYAVPGALYRIDAWPAPRAQFKGCEILTPWTLSQTMRRGLQKTRDDVPIEVSYAPFDYTRFREASKAWDKRAYNLVWVGRHSSEKRLAEAIGVMAHTKGQHLIISQDRCGQLPSNITLLYNPSPEQIAEGLGNSRILISTSTNECCALVFYEAQNAGCYVLATDVGSAREQVGHGNFFQWNSPSLVDDMQKGAHEILRLGFSTKDAIKAGMRFDIAQQKDHLTSLVAKAVGEQPKPAPSILFPMRPPETPLVNELIQLMPDCPPDHKPKVSLLLMASWADTIEDSLYSALSTIGDYHEILVGMAPRMPERLQRAIHALPRVRVFPGTDKPAQAGTVRFRLMDEATGDFICNVDDDDIWTYFPWEDLKYDYIYGDAIFFGEAKAGNYTPGKFLLQRSAPITRADDAFFSAGSQWIVRTSAYREVRHRIERYWAFSDFRLISALLEKHKLHYTRKIHGIVRVRKWNYGEETWDLHLAKLRKRGMYLV